MNSAELDTWREAAAIAGHVREYVASLMKPGAKLIDLSLEGHRRIEELGGKAAFPLQISVNHVAAHYCAYVGDESVLAENDLVKVDCGVHVDGYVADTARTVDLSKDGRHARFIAAAKGALDAAIAIAGPGVDVVDIGREVERVIRSQGLNPVRNLTGHGVGRWIIHRSPQIPNVPSGRGRLKAGTCVAIEPFATDGPGQIHEEGDAHVFMAKKTAKKVKGSDPAVLDAVRAFGGLPFGSRDLLLHHPYTAVADTLNALMRANQLMVYPPLCEKPGTFVAQFEHTVYVHDDGVEVLTANTEPSRKPAEAATRT
ncbi:MAG: type II methionyl aminopeptidase [Planctomycetota bacterium JB042]